MKKILVFTAILLITGGITYGVKNGAILKTAKNDGQGGSAVTESTNSERGKEGKGSQGRRSRRGGGGGGPRVSVEVADVKIEGVQETLSYVGSLLPKSSVDIYSKVEGRLEKMYVDLGSPVEKGSLLAKIDDEEILQAVREAEAALAVAGAALKEKEAELKNLDRQLQRAKQLFEKNFISQQELDTVETQHYSALAQAELARAQIVQKEAALENVRIQLRNTEIRSPLTGYVGKMALDPGAMVKTSTPILSLVDVDPITTLISVVEKDYRQIRPGLSTRITLDAFPGKTFSGKVARVSPVVDRETRTADVEIEIPNRERILKPGMFARVTLTVRENEKSLMVPEEALVGRGDGFGVYKVDGQRARFVRVRVGAPHQGKVEIIEGIAEGDRVVTLGAHMLRDGSRVQVVGEPESPES